MSTPERMGIDSGRRNRIPRQLTEEERARLDEFLDGIHYSTRYSDSEYEYRHVQLPKAMLKAIPSDYHDKAKGTLKLLWEDEWRGMGITQVCTVVLQTGWPDADYIAEPWLGTL
ncbi:regulatory subunit of cyclin-dependent kinase [Chaetomium tenue]|uniref:Regulatory subunit of cyclin-dependent kinase n=1 Tax=Chaetomium tenue TaxID=1854479 RepID=A0ACB7PR98_9PEZI|nr:regulatory subunit of cyclin-dependent kinase [Chaetomium globosum]